ncbi:hypothetical protein [Streptomyces sp. NPDC058066]|uniref:hypothetical protein n=1 Tax=Streptomyces sp. NPDC058066 TaxID=3346323 RepID=UPI0036E6AE06
MTEQAETWPTFTLQRWDWSAGQWQTRSTYGPDERGGGNAYFAVSSERASQTGPIRLLRDGAVVLGDDPATYYDDRDF